MTRSLAKHIDTLERRASHLRDRVRSGRGGSYDRAELAALEEAIETMRVRRAEANVAASPGDLLEAVRASGRGWAAGRYQVALAPDIVELIDLFLDAYREGRQAST
jgi:hypothetical protein